MTLGRESLRRESQTASQAPGIQHTVDAGDYILGSIELIGHRSGVVHHASRPSVPQHMAVGRIERQKIAGSIRSEEQMARRGQDTRATKAFTACSLPSNF